MIVEVPKTSLVPLPDPFEGRSKLWAHPRSPVRLDLFDGLSYAALGFFRILISVVGTDPLGCVPVPFSFGVHVRSPLEFASDMIPTMERHSECRYA